MFQSARLKLTAWYLLIIIFISGLFSVVIYTVINQEYNRFEQAQLRREERDRQLGSSFEEFRRDRESRGLSTVSMPPIFDPEAISEARRRLQMILLLVNLGILAVAGFLGYFLAGRTLRPIKEIIEEQYRFITDASHELRTPITSLRSEIEVSLRDKNINKDTKKILESNLEEVSNLQTLSDSLIKLTQYQKSNGNIVFSETSLSEIIEEACRKVAILAKHKNIKINNKTKDSKLEAEKQSLVEMLVIFLDNAIKYSSKNTTVTLISKEIDHSIMLYIKDQGLGIAKEDLPHIFDRFYRIDKARTKSDVHGYGLGLSIAKQIIDKHHGVVKVISQPKEGTTFSIQLPTKQSRKLI